MSATRLADAYEALHRIDAITPPTNGAERAEAMQRAAGHAQHALALAAVEHARGALITGLTTALETSGPGAFTSAERAQLRGDIRTLCGLPREKPAE